MIQLLEVGLSNFREVAKAGIAGAKAGFDEAKKTYNENKNK